MRTALERPVEQGKPNDERVVQEQVARGQVPETEGDAEDGPPEDADLEEVTDVFLSVTGFLGLLLVVAVGAVVVFAVAALQNL